MTEPYIGMPITLGGGCMGGWMPPERPAVPPANSGSAGAQQPSAPSTPNMPSTPSTPSTPNTPNTPNTPGAPYPDARTFDTRYLGSLPLAMTYTPMQQWKSTYSDAVSLARGTIFPELDLPFEGKTILTERAKGGQRQ